MTVHHIVMPWPMRRLATWHREVSRAAQWFSGIKAGAEFSMPVFSGPRKT